MLRYQDALKAYAKERTGRDVDRVSVDPGTTSGCDTCDWGATAATISYRDRATGSYGALDVNSVEELLRDMFRLGGALS